MALRLRSSKDVKKSSYYVWYLGAREAKGVDAMPGAIAYLLERERLQEPFKVTLQVSSKGLKIIQTVHPGMSTKAAVKHLVPGHAVLAAVQREDVVAATLLLPNPATNNPVHVHAYRCDSVETAEILGAQLKALASNSDNSAKINGSDSRIRSNIGSDGRSTRESESSEGSGEHRHIPVQSATIYESLAAELRAKLGRGNSGDNDVGPILLPPRDYDTVHRHRGNLAGIEFRRCLNQNIVGGNTAIERGGTRSAASSGIGSDSAATPPPYQPHHPLGPRPSRPSRDTSSDEDWGGANEDSEYLQDQNSNVALPRVNRSPERSIGLTRGASPNSSNRIRRAPELRQRSPSPQYQPKVDPIEVTSPRERFQDAKEMFKAMERENNARPVIVRPRESSENRGKHKLEQSRQLHEIDRTRHLTSSISHSAPVHHDHLVRRSHPNLERDKERDRGDYRSKPSRTRVQNYSSVDHLAEIELSSSRPRPRSFYDNSSSGRVDQKDSRHVMDLRERESRERHSRDLMREKTRIRPMAYQEIPKHDRYHLDRENSRQSFEILPTPGRYRHSYAEPPRLGLAALDPY
ncbi:uncharacterized protein LOC130662927 [Microplitis mediator]|uniref:uncharacterized protein LOC130662927 n=1 Tax=Microplitis mediator TaxID=375433 RepID=UPI002552CCF1|nr:uncharacterized protein LOC130662927 [Microplitis mediator]XP_057317888.1 uncharacterized protein LOC130662927 [Microplitis mediator]XP_057317889.1 uncharacterized protein LOC130662927 [Microplitis mediator]